MPAETDWTAELPPVEGDPSCQPGSNWQEMAEPPSAGFPPRPRLASAWYRANLYGTLALWTGAVLTACWLLLVICWAMWNAR